MLKTGTTHIERSDSRLLEHPCFNDIHSTIKKYRHANKISRDKRQKELFTHGITWVRENCSTVPPCK